MLEARVRNVLATRRSPSLDSALNTESKRLEATARMARVDLYTLLDADRQEIRLLHINAGSGTEAVQCTLKQAFLSSDPLPKYETISYCWGDQSQRGSISIGDTLLDVPRSAEVVLRRMRLHDAPRMVWIDAVCINQNDIDERNQQVALMYKVYLNTVHNLIWLGDDDGTTGKALQQVASFLEDARVETDDYVQFKRLVQHKTLKPKLSAIPGPSFCSEPNAMKPLFSSPWFRRLWVDVHSSTQADPTRLILGD